MKKNKDRRRKRPRTLCRSRRCEAHCALEKSMRLQKCCFWNFNEKNFKKRKIIIKRWRKSKKNWINQGPKGKSETNTLQLGPLRSYMTVSREIRCRKWGFWNFNEKKVKKNKKIIKKIKKNEKMWKKIRVAGGNGKEHFAYLGAVGLTAPSKNPCAFKIAVFEILMKIN